MKLLCMIRNILDISRVEKITKYFYQLTSWISKIPKNSIGFLLAILIDFFLVNITICIHFRKKQDNRKQQDRTRHDMTEQDRREQNRTVQHST